MLLADRGEGSSRLATHVRVTGLSLAYRIGDWDDTVAGLDTALMMDDAVPVPYIEIFLRGLRALVAAHRDDRSTAERHLALVPPVVTGIDRDNAVYMMLAGAMLAERAGSVDEALAVLQPVLLPEYATDMIMRHLLLPHLVRLALAAGHGELARSATMVAEQAAKEEAIADKVTAAQRCLGLLHNDPEPLAAAVETCRAGPSSPELADALADSAVVLGRRGDPEPARQAFAEAVDIYDRLGAGWDIMRLESRMRSVGIRRGARGRRGRPTTGWDALTPTELRVAGLVAAGLSNPDIAAELYLSRRTVQTHVSHILAKLAAPTRRDIARIATSRQREQQ
jgi:DNA-binding NarL/FixJ family response regulator